MLTGITVLDVYKRQEEGIEEYDPRFLRNVTLVTIDDESQLSRNKLKQLEQKYRPKQILIEYNGMWEIQKLYFDYLPSNWLLYQVMTFVDATTFNMYVKNMGALMMEKIKDADMIVFNRCTEKEREALRARNLKMVNRRADIYLENMEMCIRDSPCPLRKCRTGRTFSSASSPAHWPGLHKSTRYPRPKNADARTESLRSALHHGSRSADC